MTYRRLRPAKALMLGQRRASRGSRRTARASRSGRRRRCRRSSSMAAPLGPCAANVADLEIRSQGTVGGNLCAGEGCRGAARRPAGRVPRARRDGPLGRGRRASPRSRSRTSSPKRGERLLLERELRRAGRGGVRRRSTAHTRTTTRHSRCRVHARADGTLRLAATGAGSWRARLPSAEAAAGDPAAAGEAALERRHAARRRARLGLVPHEGAARCSCAASSPSSKESA